jgi:hypothetical protein
MWHVSQKIFEQEDEKMEASFCSLAPVENAVRGLVNGIESVEETP